MIKKKKFLAYCQTCGEESRWMSVKAQNVTTAKKFLKNSVGVRKIVAIFHALTEERIPSEFEA